ncbi:MAG: polysaccharide biosynthesis C-terminal domain-containing protein, partial [Sinobacterium sp.]|nr:polysaccharide biosynthesis C-terminal domain-containing protein [Sinobacterium sp.]
QAYTLGLLPFMLIKVLAPGYYAQQDMKTPVKIGVIAMVTNMGFNVAFAYPLHVHYQIGHVGLALATFASAGLNAGLLLRGLLKKNVYVVQPGFWLLLVRTLIAATLMSALLVAFTPEFSLWVESGWLQRVLPMLALVVGGVAVYIVTLLVLGLRLSDVRSPVAN